MARYLPLRSRCLHPGQQQGRRCPSSSSSWVRRMRRSRVGGCLASRTQQMNSLRASGVRAFHAASAVALAISAVRRSVGILCATPPGTRWLITDHRNFVALLSPPCRCRQELVDEDRRKPLLVPFAAPAAVGDEQAIDLGRGEGGGALG